MKFQNYLQEEYFKRVKPKSRPDTSAEIFLYPTMKELRDIHIPTYVAANIFEFLPIGNERNALIAAESGERQNSKRLDIYRKKKQASGETAADAVGGRTRRRHGKRKSKKSRKTKKTRYSKRR
jgi:hypothetical protein